MKHFLRKSIATLSVLTLGAMLFLTGCSNQPNTNSVTPDEVTPDTIAPPISANDNPALQRTSPSGDRQMILHNDDRYVFLNNGELVTVTADVIGEKIGEQDGGTIYALNNYDPFFRIAFCYEDVYYVCENAGDIDDSGRDISNYFTLARLKDNVLYADIFDHMGTGIYKSLTQEEARHLLDVLATAQVATLENTNYEQIAKAQAEGFSYLVSFTLADHSNYLSYIIPSLGYVTVGDYTCTVENLEAAIGTYFIGLVAPNPTIVN